MIELVTWPVAFSFIGGLIVVAGAAIKIFKKETDPEIEEIKENLTRTIAKVEALEKADIDLKAKDDDLKRNIDSDAAACRESFLKLEKKIEKVTDLMIDLIRTSNS